MPKQPMPVSPTNSTYSGQSESGVRTLLVRDILTIHRLHGEKLAAAEAELDQLNRPQPIHPDYVAQLQCIAARRDLKIQQECARLRYKIQALQTQTLAEHAQLHTQFFQEAREIREDRLSELGTAWYDIQKERRQCQTSEVADKYTFKFPTKYSDQIRNQANYNREVSIISGLQRYVGFPAAPEIHGARSLELDDDLKAMKVRFLESRQKRHKTDIILASTPATATRPTSSLPESGRCEWHGCKGCPREMGGAEPVGKRSTSLPPAISLTLEFQQPTCQPLREPLPPRLSSGS